MREITHFLHLCNSRETLRQECSGDLWEIGTANTLNVFPVPYTYFLWVQLGTEIPRSLEKGLSPWHAFLQGLTQVDQNHYLARYILLQDTSLTKCERYCEYLKLSLDVLHLKWCLVNG